MYLAVLFPLIFSGVNKDIEKCETPKYEVKTTYKNIQENNIKVKSDAIYAFYNPPFTLPFPRRNEFMYIVD